MTESRRAPRSALAGVALWTVIGLLLLTAGFVAFALSAVESANRHLQQQQEAQGATISQQGTVISKLASGLDTTRRQLQQHGVQPKAPAASSIVRGVQGVPGVPGPAGPSGSPGATGAPGAAGPSGAPGRNGSNGSPGSPGPSGAPGTVGQTGATGPAGPQGSRGEQGPQGPQGPKGDTGATGPAPSGWTFTYTPPVGPSTTYDCTPDSPGSTHYTCTPVSNSGPLKKAPLKNAVALLAFAGLSRYRRLDPTGRHAD